MTLIEYLCTFKIKKKIFNFTIIGIHKKFISNFNKIFLLSVNIKTTILLLFSVF